MEYFMYLFAAAAIVFPWYLISATIDRSPKRQEKALRKAIEQGHVVTAVFVKSYQKEKGNGRQCDYKYEVNGKTYRCSIFSDNPPRTLQLYYVRNPKNANIATAINVSEKNWFLRFAIIAAIIIFFAKVIVYGSTIGLMICQIFQLDRIRRRKRLHESGGAISVNGHRFIHATFSKRIIILECAAGTLKKR